MTMTRQEQLDAVVRNYGVWEGDAEFPFVVFEGGECYYIADEGPFSRGDGGALHTFTRAEVEQRKAELQNKPSWDDAPKGARIIAYSPCVSQWVFASYPDAKPEHQAWFGIGRGEWFLDSGVQGEVIGDWRDTLEKRPESNTVDPRNGECIGGAEWDGEGLPPTGVECEVKRLHEPESFWGGCFIVGETSCGEWIVVESHVKDTVFRASKSNGDFEFRPIKSDREKWIDAAKEVMVECYNLGHEMPSDYLTEENTEIYMAALYDAGLAKLPHD